MSFQDLDSDNQLMLLLSSLHQTYTRGLAIANQVCRFYIHKRGLPLPSNCTCPHAMVCSLFLSLVRKTLTGDPSIDWVRIGGCISGPPFPPPHPPSPPCAEIYVLQGIEILAPEFIMPVTRPTIVGVARMVKM